MSSEADTLPTLQTVLDEMRAGFASVNQRLDRVESRMSGIEARVSAIEHQLEQMDIRADRLEGYVNKALSELFNLRADFKEFKSQFNQPA